MGSGHKFALIIDGKSLAFALYEHSSLLRKLCKKCAAVLCCRMTPLQKAEVCLLKLYLNLCVAKTHGATSKRLLMRCSLISGNCLLICFHWELQSQYYE